MGSVQLLENHLLWTTLYQSRQARYGGNEISCIVLILSAEFISRLSAPCLMLFFAFQDFSCNVLIKSGSFTVQIVKPRPVQAASIPGMLGMFQNVWNLCYEVFFMIFVIFCLIFSTAFKKKKYLYAALHFGIGSLMVVYVIDSFQINI